MLHPAFATHQHTRWMRPDAPRWLRPDAAKFLKPGSDPADVYPALARQREVARQAHDPAIDVALAHERSVLGGLRSELAAVKSDLVWRRLVDALARKYSPSQPRVPAGSTGGGQWTSGSGGGSGGGGLILGFGTGDDETGFADAGDGFSLDGADSDVGFDGGSDDVFADDGSSPAFDDAPASDRSPGITDTRVVSDADPEVGRPGEEYAQADGRSRRYSVNLDEEEVRGGHTQREHVGLSDDELMSRVQPDQGQAGIYRYAKIRHGTFSSRESANDFVNRTLENNQDVVDRIASGELSKSFVNSRFGYATGREAFRPNVDSMPYLRDTYEVGVDIRRDPSSSRGYRVHTAYPRNSPSR